MFTYMIEDHVFSHVGKQENLMKLPQRTQEPRTRIIDGVVYWQTLNGLVPYDTISVKSADEEATSSQDETEQGNAEASNKANSSD